jgi:F-box and leucine-rich repeat protein GRR1
MAAGSHAVEQAQTPLPAFPSADFVLPGMPPARTSRVFYRLNSPSQSTTSLSENEDDDINKSLFLGGQGFSVVSPAQWASRHHHLPDGAIVSPSPMSQLPPEVLIHILKHLHTPRDLYHSLLVSRSWCECSVELLWHRPSFTRLSTLVKMMRVLSRGDQTFIYSRFIRRLNFLFLGADLTDALFCRLAQCDHLERLTLVNCSSISEDALLRVLPCLQNLVAIDLTGVIESSDQVIIGLASAARRLQGINLAGCKHVTDAGIYALASSCPLLRRVKLSGVDQVTDGPVSALAKSCPLLLEIDLNNCKRITDICVRDIWTYSTHMREMRLSQCVELTDAAFPAPVKPQVMPRNNPFPTVPLIQTEGLPPLEIPRPLDHLRMLDLTGCALITDDAVEGIISHASKIRNLVLSKCVQLTDKTVENICLLGKHLHYLHLGHAANITDRSIKTLARCCTRLRYVDFASAFLFFVMRCNLIVRNRLCPSD